MSIEDFNLWEISENWNSNQEKVSEEDKKQVAEDWKKAKAVHQQVKKQQKKNNDLAVFLSKILWRYYNNPKIINHIHWMLNNIKKTEKLLYNIFSPFVLDQDVPDKISSYVALIKSNFKKIEDEEVELIWDIIEAEKLGWEVFWKNLKSDKSEISYEDFKKQILQELKS